MPFMWLALQAAAALLLPQALALDLPKYAALKTSQHNATLEITFHNPASDVNTWSQDIQVGMTDIVRRLQEDNQTTVVIFKSDVPRFFMNHLDPAILTIDNAVENFSALMYNISTLPQVTIGAVEGRARNAGNELLMALDMRFAVNRDVLFGQFEVGLGTFPGGGGSQQLPKLIGRGLAMEYILTAKDITPKEAERIGWINKAFDSPKEMYDYINGITSRLTLFPRGGVLAAKKAINYRANPLRADYEHDVALFNPLLANPDFPQILSRVLALTNNVTLGEVELNFGRDVILIYK
ncbi:Enoyl-CoA hydratase/isomerase [Fusarium oxysporum f. sp. vasinfectum]|uniref:Enoyl-CoA hydratase n=1 Tax=Fusarium oxysporum f. sp. vasinfectum 25433 TaxID=1089449 RepID=X0KQE9_FUSOX|nr:enoyl-CoA hydratase [Fusarium oxysporum f. sp. vasinfectum 25433]KAK2669820.1 Enoyl-CoA hydratase/isomerase [Fusarium oxysporum f. sp. vasinfectum]KAK2925331.1 Enoyl-CoA hydratase/isomerase [Fusarium oxysporum f. sp. vasinfectum]